MFVCLRLIISNISLQYSFALLIRNYSFSNKVLTSGSIP